MCSTKRCPVTRQIPPPDSVASVQSTAISPSGGAFGSSGRCRSEVRIFGNPTSRYLLMTSMCTRKGLSRAGGRSTSPPPPTGLLHAASRDATPARSALWTDCLYFSSIRFSPVFCRSALYLIDVIAESIFWATEIVAVRVRFWSMRRTLAMRVSFTNWRKDRILVVPRNAKFLCFAKVSCAFGLSFGRQLI